MAPAISVQLKKQKLRFDADKAREFQELRVAICKLGFAGIFLEKQEEKARQRLFSKINTHVNQKNKYTPQTRKDKNQPF